MHRQVDLPKEHMYQAVKTLVECEANHIHLWQQKLFTLYSVAFQYLLYSSTKNPGHYIIRIEDSYLAQKLVRKSKDQTTRKFMDKLFLPRRLKYGKSTFVLDFFHVASWALTKDIPAEKIKAALIVKNTSNKAMDDMLTEEEEAENNLMKDLPPHFYLTPLVAASPKTITIAYNEEYPDLTKVGFDFIKESIADKVSKGVKLANDINIDELDKIDS